MNENVSLNLEDDHFKMIFEFDDAINSLDLSSF